MRFRSLASGSSGNATLIEARESRAGRTTRVLVDCGVRPRQLAEQLAVEGLTIADLDGIFITHEHSDHIGCAEVLARRHRIPLWCSAGTAACLGFALDDAVVHRVRDGQVFAIGGVECTPFTVPHDAREPLQLRVTDGDRVLGLMTDAGHVTPYAMALLAGVHALVLESNHDTDLLARSAYPDFLKRRVAGQHGHLSNPQAAAALAALRHERLRTVVAAHLSERNNTPAIVSQSFAAALGCAEGDVLLATRFGGGWLSV